MTVVLGILNVTPDSFSDGGLFAATDAAIARGLALREAGADLVDVGGESTRPGAARLDPAVEAERIEPVVAALAAEGVAVSIDTLNASTAERALAAGARVVNDVSGGLADPRMAAVVAEAGVDVIAMHWRGAADAAADYRDVVTEVRDHLAGRVDAFVAAGVAPERVILDPGLGFAKEPSHNWALLAALPEFAALGHRILVGASRKRFLGALLPDGAPVTERDLPTAVLSALVARDGAWGVRVHDVAATRLALDVADRVAGARR